MKYKPILFKGVNRHEHDEFTGHVVSRESMLKDIEIMKCQMCVYECLSDSLRICYTCEMQMFPKMIFSDLRALNTLFKQNR